VAAAKMDRGRLGATAFWRPFRCDGFLVEEQHKLAWTAGIALSGSEPLCPGTRQEALGRGHQLPHYVPTEGVM